MSAHLTQQAASGSPARLQSWVVATFSRYVDQLIKCGDCEVIERKGKDFKRLSLGHVQTLRNRSVQQA